MDTYSLTNMIDHHCHMVQTTANEGAAMAMLQRAFDEGLFAIIDAGDINKSFADRLAMLQVHERAFLVSGLHPLDVNSHFDFEQMVASLSEPKVIGVGEIGLDFSRSEDDKDKQRTAFDVQLTLADQYDLPAMIHIRDAFDDAYHMVRRMGIPRFVIHCFTGDKHEAKRWLDLGAYLSFSGLITFKNAQDIQEAVQYTPLNRILCETDSPYLSPVPHRGKVNHPNNMFYVYQQVARLKNLPLDSVVHHVKDNFITLYRLQHLH
jgi:TatD DNase family protein